MSRPRDERQNEALAGAGRRPAAAVAGVAIDTGFAVGGRAAPPVAADMQRHHPALVEFRLAFGKDHALRRVERRAGKRIGLRGFVGHGHAAARRCRCRQVFGHRQHAGDGQRRQRGGSGRTVRKSHGWAGTFSVRL